MDGIFTPNFVRAANAKANCGVLRGIKATPLALFFANVRANYAMIMWIEQKFRVGLSFVKNMVSDGSIILKWVSVNFYMNAATVVNQKFIH